ncbi:O-antigen ligase family protein [Oceanidesulfovibrio marinus]|uniref:O-antigen polymerase n=1 Tax=Oceanidesulfovibrio marinus TaxID=370038 RepID=A0ABX6NBI5_9BACT|nr:O-antigen ligase family protein [Oceanidesulfovibrio marinus]QJT07953.1 O-antigen polymerase [Oceanidesulfovibrio marinus]
MSPMAMANIVSGYLFLYIFRPYEFWSALGSFHLERIYMIILVLCALVYNRKRFTMTAAHMWLLFFFLVLIFSSALSSHSQVAFESTWKYSKSLIFYVVLVSTIHEPRQIRRIALAFLGTMLLYVGKSANEYFFHGRYMYRMGIARMYGIDSTNGDPNSFAASICYSLPFVWAFAGRQRLAFRWQRLALLGYALLAPIAILFTGSRSGLVTGLLFLVMISLKAKRKFAMVLLAVIVVIGGWQFTPHKHRLRFLSIIDPSVAPAAESAESSAEGRIKGLLHGIDLFTSHPLFGVGPNNTTFTLNGFQAHNLYGQILGELGGLGAFAYFAFVTCTWLTLRRNTRKLRALQTYNTASGTSPPDFDMLSRLCKASSMALIMLLFNGNFGHNMFRFNWLFSSFFAVSIAQLLVYAKASLRRHIINEEQKRLPSTVASLGMSIHQF